MLFTKLTDGTGRTPRPLQLEVFKWLSNNWNTSVIGIQASTGVGKSFIAKVIQNEYGGSILVPTNNLMDQYIKDYPLTNFLKGKKHYKCKEYKVPCEDVRTLKLPPCKDCVYKKCRKDSIAKEPTIFNPISRYYVTNNEKWEDCKVVIVDEAHKLIDTLKLLTSIEFGYDKYPFPEIKTTKDCIDWLVETSKRLAVLKSLHSKQKEHQKASRLYMRIVTIATIVEGLEKYPNNYVFYTTDKWSKGKTSKYLVIEPLIVPKYIIEKVLGKYDKLILMSATLFKSDIRQIVGNEPFKYLSLPSPIPIENRRIRIKAKGFMSQTDSKILANWIIAERSERGNPNTIVHLPYAKAKDVQKHIPGALRHDPETKDKVMAEFKDKGGVWLAAGCAEGIDLPGDTCRLNLIPYIHFQSTVSPTVKGRNKLQGWGWYELDTIKTFIQQCGRSTRGVDDFSEIVCGDARIARLLVKYKNDICKSFLKSIVWR